MRTAVLPRRTGNSRHAGGQKEGVTVRWDTGLHAHQDERGRGCR